MTFDVPTDRRYTESHEWVAQTDGAYRIGITDFAQDELGDIVFVELPASGAELGRGDEFGVVESIKAVSDVYMPISGTVLETNDSLGDAPEQINEDPYSDGWMLEIENVDETEFDELLDADDYQRQIE
jgi:glycine cleavage system H protein